MGLPGTTCAHMQNVNDRFALFDACLSQIALWARPVGIQERATLAILTWYFETLPQNARTFTPRVHDAEGRVEYQTWIRRTFRKAWSQCSNTVVVGITAVTYTTLVSRWVRCQFAEGGSHAQAAAAAWHTEERARESDIHYECRPSGTGIDLPVLVSHGVFSRRPARDVTISTPA